MTAAKKFISSVSSGFCTAFDKGSRAFGAHRGGGKSRIQGMQMFSIGERRIALGAGQSPEDFGHFVRGKKRGSETFDVFGKSARPHILGHGAFENRIANKENDGMKNGGIKLKETGQALRMSIVLMQGILEGIFFAMDGLHPA